MIYFISTDKIKKITGTADAISDEKLRSCLYLTQVTHIVPLLGFECSSYIGQLVASNLLGQYETQLIEDYLQPILAWHTLALAVTQSNTQTEIATGHQSDIQPNENPYRIKNHYAAIGNAYVSRARTWLCKVRFPFYNEREFDHKGDYFGINLNPLRDVPNKTRREEIFYRKSRPI